MIPPVKKPDQADLSKIKKQIVAGFIIFRRTEEGLKFLLLYRRGGYWNFPKGHFEEGERSLATALRETEEETGLKRSELHIVPNFKTYVRFFFDRGEKRIFDTVILYLAETKQPQISISPREHSGFAWFLFPDALRILGRYQGTKRALKQANDFLRQRRGPTQTGTRTNADKTSHGQHAEHPYRH